MGLFGGSNKEPKANFTLIDGIESLRNGSTVNIGISGEILTIKDEFGYTPAFTLPITRIKGAYIYPESHIVKKREIVNGETVVDGIVLGPLANQIGYGDKERHFMIIVYDFKRVLSFEVIDKANTYRVITKLRSKVSQ